MDNPTVWLRSVCTKGGLRILDDQMEALGRYVGQLLEWNTRINLISRRDVENIWTSHILHSISPLFKVRIPDGARMIDIGTGGGLPGIPLKIMNPSMRLLLVDSTQKKINAVGEIVRELKLTDTAVRWGRAEDLAKEPDLRGRFDVVTARGVGPLYELARLAYPFVVSGKEDSGQHPAAANPKPELAIPCLLAYKGGDLEEELEKTRTEKIVRAIDVVTLAAEGLDPADAKKLVIVKF